jgi:hypothetical protein
LIAHTTSHSPLFCRTLRPLEHHNYSLPSRIP